MNNSLLTVKDVASRLKISTSTVYRVCKRGLPHTRKTFGIRIREEDLDKWIHQDKRTFGLAENILHNALTIMPPSDIDKAKGGIEVAIQNKGRRRFAYGSIYQRKPGGKWTIDYRDKNGRRVQKISRHATCWEEAHESLKMAVLKEFYSANGINKEKRKIGFHDFSKVFIKDYVMVTKKSWKSDVSRMKPLVKHFVNTDLGEISPLMIERFRSSRLKAGNTKSTVNRYIALLKTMLNTAIEEGYIKENPSLKIKLYPEQDIIKERILTEDEEAKLKAASATHLRSIITVALNSGMRPSEIFNLEWKQVDLRRRMITVEKTKAGRLRHIPINQELFQELLIMKEKTDRNPLVFPNPKTGKPFSSVKTAYKAALRRSGLVGIRLYDCRHTFASRLVQKGADIETVRSLLGHSSLKMTQRYTHSNDQIKKATVELLDSKKWYSGDKLVTNKINDRSKKQEENPLNSLFSWN